MTRRASSMVVRVRSGRPIARNARRALPDGSRSTPASRSEVAVARAPALRSRFPTMSPKRRSRSSAPLSPRVLIALAALAVVLFAGGEGYAWLRSDSGQLFLARQFGMGDRARVTALVARQLHRGLAAAQVPRDSVTETVSREGRARVRWRIGLAHDAAPLQVNYAVTAALRERGAVVLETHEWQGRDGATFVTLLVGLPKRATHEVLLVRRPRVAPKPGELATDARLALIVYGFPDAKQVQEWSGRREPFAIAIVPGEEGSGDAFRAARAAHREIVVHVPLEPENYPRVNPGPATLLVNMSPSKISSLTRRYLDQAGEPVAVANLLGSFALQDLPFTTALFREVKRAGVPFLHVNPSPGAVCRSLASDMGVAYDEPDVVLDAETRARTPQALDQAWRAAIERARVHQRLIVMLRASPLTAAWLEKATAPGTLKGVTLVPLTRLVQQPTGE